MKKKLFFVTLPLVASLLLSGCWNLNFDFDRDEEEIAGFNKKFAEELEEHGYIRSAEKISPAEVAGIEELDLSGGDFFGGWLKSLKGIEYFTNLRVLRCDSQKLEKLDLSKNTALEEVSIANNNLTELKINNCQSLRVLVCRNNGLVASEENPLGLDLSGNPELVTLDCSSNKLEDLDVGNCGKLDTLYCEENNLHSLDLKKNGRLRLLSCGYGNSIKELDLSGNPELLTVDCTNTGLKELNVENCRKLEKLNCEFSEIEELNLSTNAALKELRCRDCNLKSLDLSKNPQLSELYCSENNLTELDISGNLILERIDCEENQLTSLDISKNAELLSISCGKNRLTSLDISKNAELYMLTCEDNDIGDIVSGKTPSCTYFFVLATKFAVLLVCRR